MAEQHLIIKNGTRILRPHEVTKLLSAMKMNDHKICFETLLQTGTRYEEGRWIQRNKKCFDGNAIMIPSMKKQARHKDRFIRLTPKGKEIMNYFFGVKRKLPTYVTWDENLRRWAIQAGLDPRGISVKCTRRTWEAWLITQYPDNAQQIFLSQGHTENVAMEYYLMLPFDQKDKEDMKRWTDGWL